MQLFYCVFRLVNKYLQKKVTIFHYLLYRYVVWGGSPIPVWTPMISNSAEAKELVLQLC
jgi:hypothetical protein